MFNPTDWPISWMAHAERQHARNATALLTPHGLHHREFRILAFLANSDGIAVGALADMAVLERPTVSKLLDRLEAERWITRGEGKRDRRLSPVRLTAAGRRKFDQTAPIVEALFAAYQQGIPARERARFVSRLSEFYGRVHRARHFQPKPVRTRATSH